MPKIEKIQTISTIIHVTLLPALGRSHLNSSIRLNRPAVGSGKFSLNRGEERSSVVIGDTERKEKMQSAHLIEFRVEASSLHGFSAEFVEIVRGWVNVVLWYSWC